MKKKKFDIHERIRNMTLKEFQDFKGAVNELDGLLAEQLKVEMPSELAAHLKRSEEQRVIRDKVEIAKALGL
jgi:hypothetical protein